MDQFEGRPRKIAVLRALQLGDLLCAVPALRALRKAEPGARVILIGLPWAAGFVRRFSRYLDGFLEFPGFPGLPERPAEPREVRRFLARAARERFDLAIQMHGSGTFTNEIIDLLGASQTAGFRAPGAHNPDPARFMLYPDHLSEPRRLLALTSFLGMPSEGDELEFPLLPEDEAGFAALAAKHGLARGRYACLHPGARAESRRWPVRRFARVGEALQAEGLTLVLTGSADERDLTAHIARMLPSPAVDLAGETSLGVLAALVEGSRLLVCNDTGVSHVASALKAPSVVVFSGSEVARWAPADRRRHRVVDARREAGDGVEEVVGEVRRLLHPGTEVVRASVRPRPTGAPAQEPAKRAPERAGPDAAPPPVGFGEASVDRVLVARLDNIGDVLMTGPALRALRAALPHASVTLWVSPAGAQAAPLLPWIDDVLVHRVLWQDVSGAIGFDAARETALVAELARRRFDAAVLLTSFTQSPYPPGYLCYLAGIPIRLGQSKEFGGGVLSQWVRAPGDDLHQADRNLRLLEHAGVTPAGRELEIRIPPGAASAADRMLAASGLDESTPFVLMAPGASCATRTYDARRFAAVARGLRQAAGLPIVAVGRALDHGMAGFAEEAGRIVSLIGVTTVPELARLVERAALVVCNNSGPMHLGDALRRPMVVLYGGAELESQWRPRAAPATLLLRPTPCSPCYRFECPYGMECLDIPPGEVVRACLTALERAEDPAGQPAVTASR